MSTKITPLMQGLRGCLIRFSILLQQIREDKKIEILVLIKKEKKLLLLSYKIFNLGLLSQLVYTLDKFDAKVFDGSNSRDGSILVLVV